MPKISVIIPLYNVEKYMKKCIDSVLNQTLVEIEVILVNDGSPDKCGDIAEEYKKNNHSIKVIHKENGGLSSARNAGIDIATGEYIAFVDSDDWIEPGMFETMYDKAKDTEADLSICNYNKIFEEHIENNYLKIVEEVIDIREIGLDEYFYKYYFNYIHGDEACNKIFKRSIIEKKSIRFEKNSEIFSEDKLFNLYFIINTEKITTTNKSFYNYLQRDGSLMNVPKPKLIKQYMNLMDKFIVYSRKNNKDKEISSLYPVILLDLLNSGIFYQLESGVNPKQLKNLINEAAKSRNYKKIMFQLFIGKQTSQFCKRTNKGIDKQIKLRIYGLLHYLSFYRIISNIMYKIFKRMSY
ncbi:glycosyltransferase family 2 protein [Peribacillus frigoritolerans]